MSHDESFRASEDALHEAAAKLAGCDDFGDPAYLEGLRILLAAYDDEARFHEVGRGLVRDGLVDTLRRRLRAQKLLNEYAPAREIEISRPIVILGLVRTGSTALHHLVGQDPAVQVLEYWLACHPRPRPPRSEWEGDPDYRLAEREIDAMYAADPSLKGIHLMMPDGPEECRHFLAQSFTDDSFEVNATVPSYMRWYESADLSAAYRRHRDLLRLVGVTTPQRRWVLKYPVHMKNLRTLLDVYPDACIVWTHRDPSQVLSSYISLIAGFRAIYENDIDRDQVAREQLEVWASGAESGIEVRRQCGSAQFFDLHFRDYVSDPIDSVRRIYAHFGLELSEEGEAQLARWQQSHSRTGHGEHKHSMDAVALDRGEVLERFSRYMDFFGIEPE